MKAVCVIDTSVFCEIMGVPNKASNPTGHRKELARKAAAGESLLLPIVTIIETGNHIGQSGNGSVRRTLALAFIGEVRRALAGDAPYTVTPLHEKDSLLSWLDKFPDWAMVTDAKGKGSGLGDYLISRDFESLCRRHQGRRVYVWSLDRRLASLDRLPVIAER